MDKPELLEMIEVDTQLRDGLAANSGEVHDDMSEVSTKQAAVSERGVGRAGAHPAFHEGNKKIALAASLVLGLGVGWVVHRSIVPSVETPTVIASPPRLVYDRMRGATPAPRIENAGSTASYLLIEVAVPSGATDIVALVGGKVVPLVTSAEGFVSFLVARSAENSRSSVAVRYKVDGQEQIQHLTGFELQGKAND